MIVSGPGPLAADELLRRLLDAKVDFILVGAFAIAAHGAPRATTDLDIVPEPGNDNLERLLGTLEALDARLVLGHAAHGLRL